MHSRTAFRTRILLAFILLAPLACGGDSSTDPTDPTDPPDSQGGIATVTVSADALALHALGDSARLTVVVLDGDGNPVDTATVAWASTDTAVATVDAAGQVVARGNGAAAVVASAGEAADTVSVTVEQVVGGLVIEPSPVSLGAGDTVRLDAVVVDSNGVAIEGEDVGTVTWSSDDAAVATVDATGLVTGILIGAKTTVVAETDGANAEVPVSVLDRIAFETTRDGNAEIYLMLSDGSGLVNLTRNAAEDTRPVWSPDGTKIAFKSTRDGNEEIYVMNADGSDPTRLTNSTGEELAPTWSPDGSRLAYRSLRSGNVDIYAANADGSGGELRLTSDAATDNMPAWSPDGETIAFTSDRDPDGSDEVYLMRPDGTGVVPLTDDPLGNYGPVWSPDGSQIAFHSRRDGYLELYVMNPDGTRQLNITKDEGDDFGPAWSSDGFHVAFSSDRDERNSTIYVVGSNGLGLVRLTESTGHDTNPAWQPR